MIPLRHLRLFLFLFLLLVTFNSAHGQEAPLNGFDDYVNKALSDWEVPGLAIVIVKDDRIVLAKGYGVKNLGDPAPVNERTLFAIGSSGARLRTEPRVTAEAVISESRPIYLIGG